MNSLFFELETSVKASVEDDNYTAALEKLKEFVIAVMNMQAAPGEVVGSARVDALCELVGRSYFGKYFNPKALIASTKPLKKTMIVVCTGLYRYGGTTHVIKDLVNAHPDYECIVIASNYLENMTPEDLALSKIDGTAAALSVCPPGDAESKMMWLMHKFLEKSPSRIFLLNHHQDSVIVSAAAPFVSNADVIFYHHADYNMCLGVHLKGTIHVDPHNVGYYNCRGKEGISDNAYIPMTVDDRTERRDFTEFMADGSLTTCSSGHYHKFRNFYLYPYPELIAERLKRRGGNHIHIGEIPLADLASIRQSLVDNGVDTDRFIHIPWVESFWNAIVEQSVDLFIGSFPIGGARTTIEVMGAGIPLLMPNNYLSRFFSSRDIVYRECFTWTYPEDFLKVIKEVTPATLQIHSARSRQHYDAFYNSRSVDLRGTVDAICARSATQCPYALYDYEPDQLDRALHFKHIDVLLAQYAADEALAQAERVPKALPVKKRGKSKMKVFGRKVIQWMGVTARGAQPLSKDESRLFNLLKSHPESLNFNSSEYAARNPDVAAENIDPLVHFVKYGQYEGRGPSPFFSSDWHIAMNEDGGSTLPEVLLHLAETRSDRKRKKAAFFIYAWNVFRMPDPYIREMVAALASYGVNVDVYVGGQFAKDEGPKGLRPDVSKSGLGNFIHDQDYDFALCFNNSLVIPETVAALRCTIVSVMVDSIHHMLDQSGEGLHQAFGLPIHVAPIYTSFLEDAKDVKGFKAAVSFMPAATVTEKRERCAGDELIEISWVASMLGDYHLDSFLSRVDLEVPNGLDLISRCLSDIQKSGEISMDPASQKAAKILCDWSHWDYPLLEMHMQEIVTNGVRLAAVEKLAPLGLKFYGNARWRSALMVSPATVQSFRSGANLRRHSDLCAIYDQSKISINIPQIHAGTGMQYRILDILASKSLLITQHVPNSDMEYLFGADSPIVTFTDLEDLHRKCIYYLQNETERKARVEACNALVANGFSFRNRVLEYLELSNLAEAQRLKAGSPSGSVTLIWPERVIEWASRNGRANH